MVWPRRKADWGQGLMELFNEPGRDWRAEAKVDTCKMKPTRSHTHTHNKQQQASVVNIASSLKKIPQKTQKSYKVQTKVKNIAETRKSQDDQCDNPAKKGRTSKA